MGIRVIQSLAEDWFTPTVAEGSGARFLLRPLGSFEQIGIQAAIGSGDVPGAWRAAVETAVRGWEGIEDESGQPLAFDRSKIGGLPFAVVLELGAEVVRRARLTEAQKKT